jgi:hypothetical protein
MPCAVPVSAEGPAMPPSQAGSENDGDTVLDQGFDAASLSGLRGAVLKSATAAGVGDDRAIDVMLASWPVVHGHGLWLVQLTADQMQALTGPAGSVVTAVFAIPEG